MDVLTLKAAAINTTERFFYSTPETVFQRVGTVYVNRAFTVTKGRSQQLLLLRCKRLQVLKEQAHD